MQMIRSALFVGQIYVAMLVLGIVFAPYAIFSRNGAYAACKTYCKWVFWTMGWMVGIKGEVRGEVPQGEVLIASKHQSFLDIMLIFHALPAAKFIMKRELLYAPIIGIYAKRLGCVPVARGQTRSRDCQDGERCRSRSNTSRSIDHLFAGHACRSGRQSTLQSRHRHSVRAAGAAVRSCCNQCGPVLAAQGASRAGRAMRLWNFCR